MVIHEDTAIFIRAKLSSTRLPRKHLLPVRGKPIIEHLIDRIRSHTNIGFIVLCTTNEEVDDELVSIATSHGIYFHRWNKGDVLRQYVDAARKFGIRNIINIDADDPLIDYTLIDGTAAIMEVTEADYVTWEGYPLGCTPSGMSVVGLKMVASKHPEAIEHVFAYLEREPNLVKLEIKKITPLLLKPYIEDIRLTLDYPEDYELIKILIENIQSESDISFQELMEYIDTHQNLIWINSFRNAEFRAKQQDELQKAQAIIEKGKKL